MKMLDAGATAAALPPDALVEALRAMLLRRHAGLAHAPERLAVPLTGGILLAMPATDGEFASTKLVTVHAGNPARGLPSLLGEVLLMRADTGERLLMLDGPTVTALRTAALSVLAARTLAPRERSSMLIVGAGVQARAHLEAFANSRELQRVWIVSRTPASAQALASHARTLGIDATAIGGAGEAIEQADLIVTATTATAPVIGERVRDDAFVAAVGAYRPQMCELPATLVRRATVFVDDHAGARHEAGDIIQAGLDWGAVTPLEQVLAESQPGEAAPGGAARRVRPIVFKSVGQALWDLAAARLAWERIGDAN